MALKGLSIVFDGVSSEVHDLYLMGFDTKNRPTDSDLGEVDLVSDYIRTNNTHLLYGAKENKPLVFTLILSSFAELDRHDIENIQKWLFGHGQYKKLQIVQDDYVGLYFNCITSKIQKIEMNNKVYGVKCTFTCDSPYAYEFEDTITYNTKTAEEIVFINYSSVNDYMYPKVEFMCIADKGEVSIINLDDNERETRLHDLYYGEKVIMDSNLDIINTNLTRPIADRFNKKFLRFVEGDNTLKITGDIDKLDITYQTRRRVGI